MFDLPKYKLYELILDKVIDEFAEQQDKFVFKNIQEAKGYQFRSFRESQNLQKKIRKCIFPGCTSLCIKKSHTIQRACLQTISESQHLLTPGTKEGETIIVPIGINEASTFPGFCQVHEEVFKEFEKSKKFDTDKSFYLQILRTICREIVIMESQISGFQRTKTNYIQYRNLQLTRRFKELSGLILSPALKSINVECENSRLKAIENKISEISSRLKQLKKLYRKLYSDINSTRSSKFCIEPIEFDWVMPVALAGMTGLTIKRSKSCHNIILFMNIIPFENKTLVILGGESKNKGLIQKYKETFCNPLAAINIIERWMVYGSDHWFIRPSVWDKIPNERQKLILEGISKEDKCIFDDLSLSIFDDLRKDLINLAKSNTEFYQENRDFVRNEERKLV